MRQKKFIIFSFVVMIASIAMSLTTNAMAQTWPEQCVGGKFDLEYVEGPITIYEPTHISPFGSDVTCAGGQYPCYFWHWVIKGNDRDLQTLTAVTIYHENHTDDPISLLGGAPSTARYTCDQNRLNSWGQGICNGVVIQFNSQAMVQGPGSRDIYITTNKNVSGLGSAAFHSGQSGGKVDNCLEYVNGTVIGGIKAPGYTLGTFDALAVEDVIQISGIQIKILRNPSTGCGFSIQVWNSQANNGAGAWEVVSPTSDVPYIGGEPVVECGETRSPIGAGRCRECRVTAAGSPGYVWINLGGTWYKVNI